MYLLPQSEKVIAKMTGSSSICEDATMLAAASSSANVSDGPATFLVRDWDPLIPRPQSLDFDVSTALSCYNVGVIENQQISRVSCLGSDFPSSDEQGKEKDSKGKKRKRMPEYGAFDSQSPPNWTQNRKAEQRDVLPKNIKDRVEKDEIKQQTEVYQDVSTRKLTSKPSKDLSQSGDAPKDDYIHVRAKRGQATNSHSLAERVRREKISERMKYLQDLVPGCNKITGKAVMLDEIINYVQSLQRQVEFLSMKLATVNQELDFDIDQILFKNDLCPQDGSSSVTVFGQGMSSSHTRAHGSTPHRVMQADIVMSGIQNSVEGHVNFRSQICPFPQISNVWADGLHNAFQMGFATNTPLDGIELSGPMKMELAMSAFSDKRS